MAVPLGVILTGDQLTSLQALAARHVAFSLTESCPLRCAHCIVATVSPADKSRTMTLEDAESYASQLPALRLRGVETISFTGGEPLVVPDLLELLSSAAVGAGMRCTVVSSCHWATSEETALRTIDMFPCIASWHLSTDVFHEEFIPGERVVVAALAARKRDRQVMVRMATSVPPGQAHEDLYGSLRERLPEDVPIVVQPVTRNGRGASIATEIEVGDGPAWPCMPNGMVVRYDGTVSPCCAGLVDQREGHPFQYPKASEVGLAASHRTWCTDPLLQLIRTVGFAPLLGWVEEAFPDHSALKAMAHHPCECCLRLWSDEALGPELRRRAELPENRAKIALLVKNVFGETFFQEEAGFEGTGGQRGAYLR